MIQETVITLNGKPCTLHAGATVADAVRTTGVEPSHAHGIAVAVNERIVRRGDWDREISSGDVVEVVTAQQGG